MTKILENIYKLTPSYGRSLPFKPSPLQIEFDLACKKGDLKKVVDLIDSGTLDKEDLSRQVNDAISDNLNLLKILIAKGAIMPYRATLYALYVRKNLEILDYVLTYYYDNPIYDDDFCDRALGYATLLFPPDLSLIEYLINKGANVNSSNSGALENAISTGKYEIADYLIQKGAAILPCVTSIVYEALHKKISSQTIKSLEFLLKNGVAVDVIKANFYIQNIDNCNSEARKIVSEYLENLK
jgi:ankyrin repeat protein